MTAAQRPAATRSPVGTVADLGRQAQAIGFLLHLTHGAVFEIEPEDMDGLGLRFLDRKRAAIGLVTARHQTAHP